MADHSKPVTTSTYVNFVTELDARFDDLAVGLDPAVTTATNVPTNAIRWSSANNKWQKWNGTAWGDLTATYALSGLSTTGNASIGGTLTSTGNATFNGTAPVISAKIGPTSAQQHTLPVVASDTVALLTATQTLTGKTLTSPVVDGGSINNATVGATTPSTGAFTTISASGQLTLSGTGAAVMNVGTTAQRPTPATGMFRFNSTLSKFEGYTGTAWGSVGGGATGGGTDEVFVENSQVVTANYTLTTGKNAHSVGPVTINSGIAVTVPSGARWLIS